MRKDTCSDFTYKELEELYLKAKLDLEDSLYEKELYRVDSRKLRYELRDVKGSLQFEKGQHKANFLEFQEKLFPEYWKEFPHSKGMIHHIVKAYEDGMLGVVVEGFGSGTLKCYMQDKTYRNIDINKKDWISFHES